MEQSFPRGRGVVGAGLAAAAGIACVVGAFMTWGTVTVAFEGGELFGQQIPGIGPDGTLFSQAVGHLSFSGISDWPGVMAALGGVVLAVAGFVLTGRMKGAGSLSLLLLVVGAGVALAAVLALSHLEAMAREAFIARARSELDRMGIPLFGLGEGLLRQVATLFRFDPSPGPGVYVSMGGGIGGALAGIFLLLPGGRTTRLEAALASWSPETRAELLRELTGPPEARTEMIGRLATDPSRQHLGELLADLEADERSRVWVVDALRRLESPSEA